MLIRELETQGEWCFRYRSYVPLVLLPPAVLALYLHRGYLGDSAEMEQWYEVGCLLVAMTGLLVRALAVGYAQSGSAGRNTRRQIAEHLNTKGVYSVVRHPLYLGNMMMMLGVMLSTKSILMAAAGTLFYLLFYERIIAREERFLDDRFGEVFRDWASRTPALWPRFSQWRTPGLKFSWRAAVKGEFYGFTAIVSAIAAIDAIKHAFAENKLGISWFWAGLFGFSFVMFLILRLVRKRTKVFEEPERVEALT